MKCSFAVCLLFRKFLNLPQHFIPLIVKLEKLPAEVLPSGVDLLQVVF